MKFVIDTRTGQPVPENMIFQLSLSPIEREVYRWLDAYPYIPRSFSFSTRQIAYEFFRTHQELDSIDLDVIRDAVAKWYNANSEIADTAIAPQDNSVTEDLDDDSEEEYFEEYKGFEIMSLDKYSYGVFQYRSQVGTSYSTVQEAKDAIDKIISDRYSEEQLKQTIRFYGWTKRAMEDLLLSRGWVVNTYNQHQGNSNISYLVLFKFTGSEVDLTPSQQECVDNYIGKYVLGFVNSLKKPYKITFDMTSSDVNLLLKEYSGIIWRNSGIKEAYENMSKELLSAYEDFGGIGPATGACPSTGAVVSCPVLPKKKKKSSSEQVGSSDDILKDIPDENKKGDCFKTAWYAFYDNMGSHPLLCHGIVTGQGPLEGIKYNHAWIEIGNKVIDRTIPLFRDGIDKQAYYSLGNIDDKLVFKYDGHQIVEKIEQWGTFGPWEDILWQYP